MSVSQFRPPRAVCVAACCSDLRLLGARMHLRALLLRYTLQRVCYDLLHPRPDCDLRFLSAGKDFKATVTRDQLEAATVDVYSRVAAPVQKVIEVSALPFLLIQFHHFFLAALPSFTRMGLWRTQAAGLKAADVAAIEMFGGGTHSPAFALSEPLRMT